MTWASAGAAEGRWVLLHTSGHGDRCAEWREGKLCLRSSDCARPRPVVSVHLCKRSLSFLSNCLLDRPGPFTGVWTTWGNQEEVGGAWASETGCQHGDVIAW